jgi:Zn-dependent metalloprotease
VPVFKVLVKHTKNKNIYTNKKTKTFTSFRSFHMSTGKKNKAFIKYIDCISGICIPTAYVEQMRDTLKQVKQIQGAVQKALMENNYTALQVLTRELKQYTYKTIKAIEKVTLYTKLSCTKRYCNKERLQHIKEVAKNETLNLSPFKIPFQYSIYSSKEFVSLIRCIDNTCSSGNTQSFFKQYNDKMSQLKRLQPGPEFVKLYKSLIIDVVQKLRLHIHESCNDNQCTRERSAIKKRRGLVARNIVKQL